MNGFTRSLDRKIEASKRRQAEEQRGQAHNKAPTQGLTDQASTANNNIPARKPAVDAVLLPEVDLSMTIMDRLRVVMRAIEQCGATTPPQSWIAERDQLGRWCALDFGRCAGWSLGAAYKQLGLPDLGAVEHGIRRITEIGIGGGMPGQMFERVIFDPAINVQEGDTIELGTWGGIKIVKSKPIEVTPGRAALPVDQICTVAEAMDRLKLAMQQDPDYARTWHDNIAMAFKDEGCANLDETMHSISEVANDAAARLMWNAFDVDTERHAARVTGRMYRDEPVVLKGRRNGLNTGIAGSLDAQLAAAKAESPAPAVRNLLAEMADDIERMLRIPPEAPGGRNEAKARGMRHFFGCSQWAEPVKADLSDAKGCITRRVIDIDQLEAMFPRKDDLSDPIKDAEAAETYIRRVHLDPEAK